MGLFESVKNNENESTKLRYDSFDGGGPEYTAEIEDETIVTCSCVRHYAKQDHEKICGAGYDVVFTFKGLKEGKTTMKISSFSPIVPPAEEKYLVTVDGDLNVKLTLLEETE
ncbi:MAG: hypothetical protein IJ571_00680 [Ruminococcus sp.]|nr:hypothetical protein [Ruminococcus sp.]